jgi:hypothetical protein
LLSLPATLDATYERILTGIGETLRREALLLLRWLAYAQSPPSLGELAEATIINPTGAGSVDVGNRGGIEDTLEILSRLVTCGNNRDEVDNDIFNYEDSDYGDYDRGSDEEGESNEECKISRSERPNPNNEHAIWSS